MRKIEKGLSLISGELWGKIMTAFQDERQQTPEDRRLRGRVGKGPSKAVNLKGCESQNQASQG